MQEILERALRLKEALSKLPQEKRFLELQRQLKQINDEQVREQVAKMYLTLQGSENLAGEQVVVLIHGIRTRAEWQDCVAAEMRKIPSTSVYPIGYGYLDVFRFWFPWHFRNRPVLTIAEQLRGIRSKHPAATLTVFAHSFGTYVVSRILREDPHLHIDRMLLCGSVIPEAFQMSQLPACPKVILNDVGMQDWWPVLAAVTSWGYGPTGTFGFKQYLVSDRFHNIGHSDFFDMSRVKRYWIPFATSGQCVTSRDSARRKPTNYLLSVLPVLPFKLLLASGVLATAYYLWGG